MASQEGATDELLPLKHWVNQWVASQLSALESNGSDESLARVKDAEKNVASEMLQLLHQRNIDTTGLENVVQEAQLLAGSESNPSSEAILDLIGRLREQIRLVTSNESAQELLEKIRSYYQQIFAKPSLAEMNQEIYEKSLIFLATQRGEAEENGVLTEELSDLFKEFLNRYLIEERNIRHDQN